MKNKMLLLSLTLMSLILLSCTNKSNSNTTSGIAKAQTVVFDGVLMDKQCGTKDKAMDGSDPKNAPQNHTKHCLQACEFSGYGIMLKNPDSGVWEFTPFDENGNALAKDYLANSTKESGYAIVVEGIKDGGIIKVSTLTAKDEE